VGKLAFNNCASQEMQLQIFPAELLLSYCHYLSFVVKNHPRPFNLLDPLGFSELLPTWGRFRLRNLKTKQTTITTTKLRDFLSSPTGFSLGNTVTHDGNWKTTTTTTTRR